MTEETILEFRDLAIEFCRDETAIHAIRGLDLQLRAGEIHGLVGESGSGKSVASRAVLGLIPTPPAVVRGSIFFRGQDLLTLGKDKMNSIRGRRIAMIFQEPSRYMNPVLTVGEQIGEQLRFHKKAHRSEARETALTLLDSVELGRDPKLLRAYPHELSGGMKQRVMIAMALACDPEILLADEPTTALDVTVQDQIIELLKKLRNRLGLAILFVSHDLAVVRRIADRVSIIYAGRIRESAATADLFVRPLHPYTAGLLWSVPDPAKRGSKLRAIPGTVIDARLETRGCEFAGRCTYALERCREEIPEAAVRTAGRNGSERIIRCFRPMDTEVVS